MYQGFPCLFQGLGILRSDYQIQLKTDVKICNLSSYISIHGKKCFHTSYVASNVHSHFVKSQTGVETYGEAWSDV